MWAEAEEMTKALRKAATGSVEAKVAMVEVMKGSEAASGGDGNGEGVRYSDKSGDGETTTKGAVRTVDETAR